MNMQTKLHTDIEENKETKVSAKIRGYVVDIHNRETYPGEVHVENGTVKSIVRLSSAPEVFILPGFIDAHVHIESSMLTPSAFSHLAAEGGTVGVVTDPHEIANVLGVEGIEYMIGDRGAVIKTFYTIPSCVPATPFDRAGAVVDAADVEALAASGRFVGLSEMMNVPGVLTRDTEVMNKIESALKRGLPVDGHAPQLSGEDLRRYVEAGISTDHECSTLAEAEEKVALGMKILIREGSAARNYKALAPLIAKYPDRIMFCTDDSHPDDLQHAHGGVCRIVRNAVADGYDLYDVLRAASHNAVEHYKLPVGLLREGDAADFIVVDSLTAFGVIRTYCNGAVAYGKESVPTEYVATTHLPNNFSHSPMSTDSLRLRVQSGVPMVMMTAADGSLVTGRGEYTPDADDEAFEADVPRDVLKIVYLNRYSETTPQVALIHGFALQRGALASSVGHDSHNIVAVGTNDADIAAAINAIISSKGGLVVADGGEVELMPLPIAGIMTAESGDTAATRYRALCRRAAALGTALKAPFMTLAFMSLVVIPSVKIGEEGLFDYDTFSWIKQ